MVERDLAKVEVAGSNPVSRSRFLFSSSFPQMAFSGRNAKVGRARYPSGKGEVCKSPVPRGFHGDSAT